MSEPGRIAATAAVPAPGEWVLSLIDLGTNSVRLDVVAVHSKDRSFRRLHREKRMARLGDGLFGSGHVDPVAVERVDEALREFSQIHRAFHGRRMAAVATAAMREAPEAAALAKRWLDSYGIAFRIISGAEEAALIAKGVQSVETLPTGAYGLIDIGGGSTELSLCQGPKTLESFSLDLGSNRVQQAFLKAVPPAPGGLETLRLETRRAFMDLRIRHHWPELRDLIGSGGTLRALRRLAKAVKAKDQPFTIEFLGDLTRQMERLDRVGLLHIPGMDERRVDLMLAGAVLLEEAANALGAQRIRSTDAGLRDGLLARECEASEDGSGR